MVTFLSCYLIFLFFLVRSTLHIMHIVRAGAEKNKHVFGCFEAGDQFFAPHLLELVQRERLRLVHQPGDLQREGRGVDVGVAVVLGRRELILRRERALDGPNVQGSPVWRNFPADVVRNVRKRHHGFALREERERPIGQTQSP